MKTILTALVLQFFVMANCMAATVTVNYNATNVGYTDLNGTFAGDDTDNDGWLEFSELSDWTTAYGGGATFAALNDLGDFDYNNNIWVPNGRQWDQVTEDAYMTWHSWTHSASTSNYNWAFVTTVEHTNVPEPGSLAILGLGLAGLAAMRRRKAA